MPCPRENHRFRIASRFRSIFIGFLSLACGPIAFAVAPLFSDRVAWVFSGHLRELEIERARLTQELTSLPTPAGMNTSSRLGWHTPPLRSAGAMVWVQVDLGSLHPIDTIALVAASGEANGHIGAGYGFPLRFRIETSDQARFGASTTIADFTAADVPNPGAFPLIVPARGQRARFVRVTATQAWPRRDDWIVALGEIMVLSGARNLAAGQPVTASASASALPAWNVANLTDEQSVLGPPTGPGSSPSNGYLAVQEQDANQTKWVQVDLGHERALDEIRLFPARPTDWVDTPGSGFPVRFRIEAFADASRGNASLIFDSGERPFINPGENPVTFRAEGRRGRYVRITATQLHDRGQMSSFALAELEVWAEGQNLASGATVAAFDQFSHSGFPRWNLPYLVDGYNSRHPLIGWPDFLAGLARRREVEQKLVHLDGLHAATVDATLALVAQIGVGVLIALALGLTSFFWRARVARRRAVEDLRRGIARDLHDEIGSEIGSIGLLSDAARRHPAAGAARDDLAEIARIAARTNESLREIVWLLDSRRITLGEVSARMRETTSALAAGLPCAFQATISALDRPCPLEFTRNLWLIFKEALHNAAKHSAASTVQVTVTETGGMLTLRVADDGRGFRESEVEAGRGLHNLRLRAAQLGGTLTIVSAPGAGTTVTLQLRLR